MKNENLVPKVRFKGFSDPWEQRKLKKFTKSYSGGTPSVTNSNYYGGEIPFIRSAEIRSSQTELYLTHEGLEESSSKLVEKGDILYALYGATSGQVGISKVNGAINQAVLAIIPTEGDSSVFIEQWLSLKKERIISKYLQGGQGNLSGKIVMNLTVNKPKIPKEEGMIGKLLGKIDHLIAANEDKLEQLKTLKKLMMQKIFSQEWRFKGFTDPWEQRKLKNIAIRVRGNDGRMELPTLTISATQGWLNQKDRFSENIAGKEQKNYTLLKKGQLSYNHGNSKTAKYGAVFKLDIYTEALVPRVYHSFTVKHNNSADFIEYLFATGSPNRELRKLVSSGARMDGLLNISFDAFFNINLQVPIATEQMKIAKFFRKTDNLIAANEQVPKLVIKIVKNSLANSLH